MLSIRNDNPLFGYERWQTEDSYPREVMCAEVEKSGRDRLMLGIVGTGKAMERQIHLGHMEFSVASKDAIELNDDDFALVFAHLLEVDNTVKAFGGTAVERSFEAPSYRNELAQNYPNPFNPTTTIAFSIAQQSQVSLTIYDVTGRVVRRLVNDARSAGVYRILWDGRNDDGRGIGSGVYFYRLKAGQFVETKKMVLIR